MKKTSLTLLLTAVLFTGSVAFAEQQLPAPGMGGGSNPPAMGGGSNPPATQNGTMPALQNPLKAESVTDLLFALVDIAVFIGVIIAVFMFIFVGFKFVWAQGNPEEIKKVRGFFYSVVIGTAIVLSAKVIVEVIKTTFISAGVVDEKLFNKP